MIKVKIFVAEGGSVLEKWINAFLADIGKGSKIIDIKFTTDIGAEGTFYNAMITYEVNDNG